MTTSPAESIAFTCAACGFHARLAQHYQGKAIRCPGCEAPQLVGVEAPTSASRMTPAGKVAFDCIACGHHADISREYAGKVVWCPGCNAVQIVPKAGADADANAAAPAVAERVEASLAAAVADAVAFLCAACGFQSRVSPSGINGVVYCLACRAPQSMVPAGDESAAPAPTSRADAAAAATGADAAAAPSDGLIDLDHDVALVAAEVPSAPTSAAATPTGLIDLDDILLSELAGDAGSTETAIRATIPATDATPSTAAAPSADAFSDIDDLLVAELTGAPTTSAAPATSAGTASTVIDVLPAFLDDAPTDDMEPAIAPANGPAVARSALSSAIEAEVPMVRDQLATPPTAPAVRRPTIVDDAITPPAQPAAKAGGKPINRPKTAATALNRPTVPANRVARGSDVATSSDKPANTRTTAVHVSQSGVRKVYRAVDADAKPTRAAARETTDDGERATAGAATDGARKGLFGKLTGRLFRRG